MVESIKTFQELGKFLKKKKVKLRKFYDKKELYKPVKGMRSHTDVDIRHTYNGYDPSADIPKPAPIPRNTRKQTRPVKPFVLQATAEVHRRNNRGLTHRLYDSINRIPKK